MSARLTYSLSDENQSLHKQIGCMNAFFQIFDRRQFLGGRNTASRSRKKLLPAPAASSAIGQHNIQMEQRSAASPGKNHKTNTRDKQRISTESSRTSFSSTTSCSSSFSSLDNNRAAHLETSLFNQADFPGNTAREFPKNHHHHSTKQLSSQSFGFREIVREKINRDALAEAAVQEEAVGRPFKHVDSPRPTRSVNYDDSRSSSGSYESFRVLARLREAQINVNEGNDISPHSATKFSRRLSYDGRESYDTLKSTIKIKELPRLSLDSRETWARHSASGTRSNGPFEDPRKCNQESGRMKDDQQEPVSSRRPSMVVAKLMGLEPLSDSTSATNSPSSLIGAYRTLEPNSLSRSRMNDENAQNRFSGSPRISDGESCSPCMKNNHLAMKPNGCSKLPVETTEKSQPNRRDFNEPAHRRHEQATSVPNSLSVYGEIEKRLASLEFTKSGKDLRALKQILEAIQKSQAMLDDKEQARELASQISTNRALDHKRSTGTSPKNLQIDDKTSARARVTNSPKTYRSPIIIIKPAKHIGKNSNFAPTKASNHNGMPNVHGDRSTSKGNKQVDMPYSKNLGPQHTNPRSLPSHLQPSTDKNMNTRISKSTKEQHCLGTETSTASPRVTSSRLHKKFGLEKQSCPTIPSSDSSRTKKINSTKVESCSTEIKLRPKSPSLNQKSTKQSSKSSICPRDVNLGVATSTNTETTSNSQFITAKRNHILQDGCKQRDLEARLHNSGTLAKETSVSSEQQSPVSVLDSTFYQDDSPSPVKKISYAFADNETLHSEAESTELEPVQSQRSAETLSTEIEILKSEINNLRKHIQLVNYSNKEQLNDDKTSLCEGMNSQHKYISEILLESGLLKDLDHGLSTIQLHSPGHLINPDLFLALEQSRAVKSFLNGEPTGKKKARSEARNKVQRKLIFDAVNEILLDKLVVESSSKQWLPVSNVAGTESRGQQILRELCIQVDLLQNSNQNGSLNENDDASPNMIWKDLMHTSNYWGDYRNNVAGIVLDVERSIFKDLITEIVMDGAGGLLGFSDKLCRKFPSN